MFSSIRGKISALRQRLGISNKTIFTLVITLIVVATLPLIVIASQQQQDLRQRASESKFIDYAAQSGQELSFVPGEIIVKLKKTTPPITSKSDDSSIVSPLSFEETAPPSVLQRINSTYDIKTIEKIFKEPRNQVGNGVGAQTIDDTESDLSRIYKLELDENAPILDIVKELEKDPEVEYAEPNYIMQAQEIPNDPYYYQMWNLSKIQIENAWNITRGSENVIVAVVDTGIDYTHQDLGGCSDSSVINGYDFAYGDNDPSDGHPYRHGTTVTGTVGALVNNAIGISGINWNIKLMPVKVLDDNGSGTNEGEAQGIKYAADNGARVINISIRTETTCANTQVLQDTISYAKDKGVTVVVAAGNDNADAINASPASCNGVITVAATGPTDQRAYYSNYGSDVDIAAPGGDYTLCTDYYSCLIISTSKNNGYAFTQGTSMAAPHVAGVAALLLAKDLSLSPDQVETILKNNGDVISTDKPIGKRLNAYKSLLAISPPTPTSTPTSTPTPIPTSTPTPIPTATPTPTPPNFFSSVQATGAGGYTCYRGCSSSTTTIKYNDTTHVQEGIGSAKISIGSSATENRGFFALTSQNINVGTPLHALLYLWGINGKTYDVRFRAVNSSGGNIEPKTGDARKVITGNNNWQLVDLTWTAPSSLSQIGAEVFSNTAQGTSFWVDSLYVGAQ